MRQQTLAPVIPVTEDGDHAKERGQLQDLVQESKEKVLVSLPGEVGKRQQHSTLHFSRCPTNTNKNEAQMVSKTAARDIFLRDTSIDSHSLIVESKSHSKDEDGQALKTKMVGGDKKVDSGEQKGDHS